MARKKKQTPKQRLEYLRGELRAERISYGELSELQCLRPYIEPGDVELLESIGASEKVDQGKTEPLTEAQKIEHYRAGRYQFPPPPVCTARWDESSWIKFIDQSGRWLPLEA